MATLSDREKNRKPAEMNILARDTARALEGGGKATPLSPELAGGPPRPPRLRPLASLLPYVRRYRGRAAAALVALLAAAVATLVVPVAIRRMIDFGFSRESASLIDSY